MPKTDQQIKAEARSGLTIEDCLKAKESPEAFALVMGVMLNKYEAARIAYERMVAIDRVRMHTSYIYEDGPDKYPMYYDEVVTDGIEATILYVHDAFASFAGKADEHQRRAYVHNETTDSPIYSVSLETEGGTRESTVRFNKLTRAEAMEKAHRWVALGKVEQVCLS